MYQNLRLGALETLQGAANERELRACARILLGDCEAHTLRRSCSYAPAQEEFHAHKSELVSFSSPLCKEGRDGFVGRTREQHVLAAHAEARSRYQRPERRQYTETREHDERDPPAVHLVVQ